MPNPDLIVACKIAALAFFMPLYLGALAYALWGSRDRFAAAAAIPLSED